MLRGETQLKGTNIAQPRSGRNRASPLFPLNLAAQSKQLLRIGKLARDNSHSYFPAPQLYSVVFIVLYPSSRRCWKLYLAIVSILRLASFSHFLTIFMTRFVFTGTGVVY